MTDNTVYVAVKTDRSLMEGDSSSVKGVFSTLEKAIESFNGVWGFDKAKKINENIYEFIFDGEYSVYYSVFKVKIDEGWDYCE